MIGLFEFIVLKKLTNILSSFRFFLIKMGDIYSYGHLVPSHFELASDLLVKTNSVFPEIIVIFLTLH